MARIKDIDEQQLEEWLATRPQAIQDLARRIKPGHLYRLASSGHRVFPVAYSENGTVRVHVSGLYNLVAFERDVFGIKPEDLEECDLPPTHEPVGNADIDPLEAAKWLKRNPG